MATDAGETSGPQEIISRVGSFNEEYIYIYSFSFLLFPFPSWGGGGFFYLFSFSYCRLIFTLSPPALFSFLCFPLVHCYLFVSLVICLFSVCILGANCVCHCFCPRSRHWITPPSPFCESQILLTRCLYLFSHTALSLLL